MRHLLTRSLPISGAPRSPWICRSSAIPATGTPGRARCGISPSAYTIHAYNASLVTDHSIQVNGLSPDKRYYYTIENQTYVIQGDNFNTFLTPPPTPAVTPVRIWAIGDFGNLAAGQFAVRDAYENYAGSSATNLWLWLGDNAYNTGTEAEYQSKVFDVYPRQFKTIPLYPSPGNHE